MANCSLSGGPDDKNKKKGKKKKSIDSCPSFEGGSKPKGKVSNPTKRTKLAIPDAGTHMNMRDLNADPGDVNYQAGSSGSGTGNLGSMRSDLAPILEVKQSKKRAFFKKK